LNISIDIHRFYIKQLHKECYNHIDLERFKNGCRYLLVEGKEYRWGTKKEKNIQKSCMFYIPDRESGRRAPYHKEDNSHIEE